MLLKLTAELVTNEAIKGQPAAGLATLTGTTTDLENVTLTRLNIILWHLLLSLL